MGFTYPPPLSNNTYYNPLSYPSLGTDGTLTYDYAQTLYLSRNDFRLSYLSGVSTGIATEGIALIPGTGNAISGLGAVSCTSLTVNGIEVGSLPSFLTGITPGTASNSKALVLDSTGNITGINLLSATSLTGTLQTGAQSNITSLGSLTGLTIAGNLTFSGASRSISGLSSLSSSSLTGTLQTASQSNITSLGSLTGLTIAGDLTFSGASRSISGLNSLSATYIYGTLQTASQSNITSVGTLGSLTVSGSVNASSYQLSGSTLYFDSLPSSLGDAVADQCLSLSSVGICTFPLGTATSYALSFDTTTSFKSRWSIFREGDDQGLTIGSRSRSIQKPIWGLRIYDAYDISGIGGTSSAGTFIPLAIVNASIGNMYTFTTNICEGFLQATQAWGTTDWCQLSTSHTALNMVCSTATNNSAVSGSNLLLLNNGGKARLCYNTTTPYVSGTYGTAPITLNRGNLYIKCTNDFNDGSTGYDTAMCFDSSNASAPVSFAFQLSTGSNLTTTNAVYMGTVTNNDLRFMTNNGLKMTLTAAGRLGIGTSTPVAPLQVTGTATYSIGAGGTANAYLYNVAGGTYSSLGLGPYSATICAHFGSAILVKTGVYAESDRRRKTDINPINITLDHYDKLNPVSYRYKEEENFKLGLIAQDAMQVSKELVSIFPNENMVIEDEETDLEGFQYTLDYGSLSALNAAAIKLLITEIKDLKSELNELKGLQQR